MTTERTLVIIKPDGVQRSLMGNILNRIERTGLKIIATKMVVAKKDILWKHYNKNEDWFKEKGQIVVNNRKEQGLPIEKEVSEYGKDILRANIEFMISGPVLAIVVQGNQAVGVVKKIVGSTEPLSSDIGTIRGDLTVDSYELANNSSRAVRNLVHCSDSSEEAERETPLWFRKEEVISYKLANEHILYDVNINLLNE